MLSMDCIRTPPLLRIAVIAASCNLGIAACTNRAADESARRQIDSAVDQTGKAAARRAGPLVNPD
jgi:hypothetical protein